MTTSDFYSPSRETTEGRIYNVSGGDWDSVFGAEPLHDERLVVNMGPQHPSTHGVLRLVLELEGETVTDARLVVGYLHTGIEKNAEFRNWTQGSTFVTRCDYLAPLFNESVYSMAVEKLLGAVVPERANLIRVMMMEINRISSHWVWLATGGMELGALTAMTNGFRARERCLDILEMITGLRMNHAYIRPGGLAQDLPEDALPKIRSWIKEMDSEILGIDRLLRGQPIWINRLKGVGWIGVEGCLSLGVTGPVLRAAGLPWDLRKTEPYLGYETYDFDVPTDDGGDCWGRYRGAGGRDAREPADHRPGGGPDSATRGRSWSTTRRSPGRRSCRSARTGWATRSSTSTRSWDSSMESLIHHFKLVTEGFRVPAGQVYVPIEGPRGELGAHVVSDGGTRPYRVHLREPAFINLQAVPAMAERRHDRRRDRLGRLDRPGDGRV